MTPAAAFDILALADVATRAGATIALVALLLLATRRFGSRAAGVLAGLPLTTVPALAWIGFERGSAVAAQVAIGSVAGCALVPVFVVAYGRAARRLPPLPTLAVSLVALAGAVALALHADIGLLPGCVLTLAGCGVAAPGVRQPAAGSVGRPEASRTLIALTAISAGLVSSLIASVSVRLNPQLVGMLAAMPIVGVATVTIEHASNGAASATSFLRGYLASLLVKMVFGAVFAALVGRSGVCGALAAALLMSLAVGIASGAAFPALRRLRWRPRSSP